MTITFLAVAGLALNAATFALAFLIYQEVRRGGAPPMATLPPRLTSADLREYDALFARDKKPKAPSENEAVT